MFIIGQGALNRPDGAAVLAMAAKAAASLGVVKDGWNGFNILHNEAALVGAHHAGRLQVLTLGDVQDRFPRQVQIDVHVQPDLVADMAAHDRPAARAREFADVEFRQPRPLRTGGQGADGLDGRGRAPERGFSGADGRKPRPAGRQLHRPGDAARALRTEDDAQGTGCGSIRRARAGRSQEKGDQDDEEADEKNQNLRS